MAERIMKGEHKARNLAWQVAASALLVEREGERVPLQELAHILKERVNCSYDTAKRHLVRAQQGKPPPQWGGAHGGHKPPKERPPLKTATIKAGAPIHAHITHPDGGYEPLGKGPVTIERSGADRIVRVELGEGRTLVLVVF